MISRFELELRALSQMDHNLIQLIDTAPLVGMYVFDTENCEWKKAECEGVLFVYKRFDKNPYYLFILNREKDDHFFQPIVNDLKLHVEKSYIMYRYKNIIYALWFHQEEMCIKIASCIQKIVDGTYSSEYLQKENNVNIVTMLQQAQQNSIEDKHVSSSHTNNPNGPPPGVVDFFITASKTFVPQLLFPSQDLSLMKTLMDDPKYNLESIEKQQKLVVEKS